jgi:hypothetical protein
MWHFFTVFSTHPSPLQNGEKQCELFAGRSVRPCSMAHRMTLNFEVFCPGSLLENTMKNPQDMERKMGAMQESMLKMHE